MSWDHLIPQPVKRSDLERQRNRPKTPTFETRMEERHVSVSCSDHASQQTATVNGIVVVPAKQVGAPCPCGQVHANDLPSNRPAEIPEDYYENLPGWTAQISKRIFDPDQ